MFNITRRFLFALLIASPGLLAHAHDSSKAASLTAAEECADALTSAFKDFESSSKEEKSSANLFLDQIIANDQPTFASLIDPNPQKNLFARAPLTAMGAAQRIYSIIRSQGVDYS
jgi:hypothetical protein